MIAALIQARLASQRCKEKLYRPFADAEKTEIALRKFAGGSNKYHLYLAIYDPPLIEIGKKYNCTIIHRTKESAFSDDFPTVFNYISEIPEKNIMFINPCCPLLTLNTVEGAISYFNEKHPISVTSVITEHQFYYHLNGKPINFLDPTSPCTKSVQPVYKVAHCFHIFPKKRFAEKFCYWTHEKNDPYFYEISPSEAIDIDTELEFEMAESFYKKTYGLR